MKTVLTAGLAAATLFAAGAWDALAQTAPDAASREAAKRLATGMCMTCHGTQGAGDNPLVPRLAGQQKQYLEAQLKAFRRQNRGDPEAHDFMWGIAATLDDNIVEGLAHYYASQPPMKGVPGDPAVMSAGRDFYERGRADKGIPACATCHGMDAEGHTVFPRLAGQYGQYLSRQMQMLRNRLRDSPVMHGVVKDLSDEDIFSLATYLQSK